MTERGETGQEDYVKIGYTWMFTALGEKYNEQPEEPIRRITHQLANINAMVRKELENGVTHPESFWEWLDTKKKFIISG